MAQEIAYLPVVGDPTKDTIQTTSIARFGVFSDYYGLFEELGKYVLFPFCRSEFLVAAVSYRK